MTVESEIYAALSPLVGGRVFPDDAPFDTERPYITYQQIGGLPIGYVSQEIPDGKVGYFQFNGWAASRMAAAALQLAIETALLQAAAFSATVDSGPISTREADLGLYGTIQDFSIWSPR